MCLFVCAASTMIGSAKIDVAVCAIIAAICMPKIEEMLILHNPEKLEGWAFGNSMPIKYSSAFMCLALRIRHN